jgi:hypothetical protein
VTNIQVQKVCIKSFINYITGETFYYYDFLNVSVVVTSMTLHWNGHLFPVGSKHTYRILECKACKGQEGGRVISYGGNGISLNHALEG